MLLGVQVEGKLRVLGRHYVRGQLTEHQAVQLERIHHFLFKSIRTSEGRRADVRKHDGDFMVCTVI